VSELIQLSGGKMDDNLASKFESITRTILSNQTEALTNLTSKAKQIFNIKNKTKTITKNLAGSWHFVLALTKALDAGGEGNRAGVAADGHHVRPAL